MTVYNSSKRIVTFFLVFTMLFLSGCENKSSKQSKEYVSTTSGLQYKILQKGTGEKAKLGDTVLLFETTSYRDGTILYSNEDSTTPVAIVLGENMVTEAVEEGLTGMKTGEIKEIISPPHLVKREIYPKNVSPDSTLVIKLIAHKVLKKE